MAPLKTWMTALAVLTAFALVHSGCGNDPTKPDSPPYNPVLPTSWALAVTNPFFPLAPGTRTEFHGQGEVNVVEVLAAPRQVNGVAATEVLDQVFVGGELTENTHDWFAQDDSGNVWYLGENSEELENGHVVSTEGSWEWGVNGALPGVVMWADPSAHVGESYRQEYYHDEAEDWGKVIALDQTAQVPYDTLSGCVLVEEWNGLESGGHEQKYYAPGIGVVLEVSGDGRSELVSLTHP